MRKYLCLLIAGLAISVCAKAAPGDTTWVQANSTDMDGGGNYDAAVTFPVPAAGVTYRNIYMIFTLGKHMCPGYTYGTGAVPWCGDWDYTVKNKLMTPGGDTLELGRFITPYANAAIPRTPYTWTQHYIYDVTDYASRLQGDNTMRISFDAGSGGWTGDIKFAFVEGIPERTVTGVEKLYSGSFNYGGTPDINTNFPALSKTAPAGTASSAIKVTVTGHGGNGITCCEFQSHNYQVMLNGASIATKAVWRDNCGLNELYPQSGTWKYNRANWCPGAIVYSDIYTLPGISAGSSYNLNLQFDPYTGSGYYIVEGTLLNYGPMNKTLDASLDDIIAPTNNENYFRENPAGLPTVRIRNTGSTVINSVDFQYRLKDSAVRTFTWTGTLNPLQDIDIVLPQLSQLNEVTGTSGVYTFIAQILTVNGVADNDATNDTMATTFTAAPRWPSSFKIAMRTNSQALMLSPTKSETSWVIYDMNNAIVAQRTDAEISTLYNDTVTLPAGLYKLAIYDSSCDGLNWWVHGSAGDGVTSGTLYVKQLSGTNIPMNGYNYLTTYNNDFGCGFTQYFYTGTPIDFTGIKNISAGDISIEAYPNPAQNKINIDINGMDRVAGTLHIIDALGRVVTAMPCNDAHKEVNVASLANGVYTILFINEASGNKLITRLLIAR